VIHFLFLCQFGMAYGLRAWTAAGHYPGTLLSPRTEKHTVTTDRFGDRVETKHVADAFAGSAAERIVTDRFGNDLRETSLVDPSGRTHSSRVRSESPRGLRRTFFDDPHYRHTGLADSLYDPLHRGHVGLSRAALDDPLYDPLHRGRVGLSRAALDDPLYDPLHRRNALDDPLYRRGVLADPLYRDPHYSRADLADPLYRDLHYGRADLADPHYRRSDLADPLYRDPHYRRADLRSDPLYTDPLYRRSALDGDWRMSSRVCGRGPFHGRSAYDDLTLARRSGNLDAALVNRELMYDLDNVAWSRTAFRNPLTGTLA